MKDFKEPIFIVDDEREIAEVIAEIAGKLGCVVQVFHTAQEALDAFDTQKPFLILSDFKMPNMSGKEFASEIRKKSATVPFVVITGFADKEVAIESLKSGVSDLLEKPFETIAVKQTIEKYRQARIDFLANELKELEEIAQFFVEEASELLSDLDQLILRLEQQPVDAVVIDSLFRKIHTVKGGASAVPRGQLLGSLAHEFENSLSKVRKGELVPNNDLINLYLATSDACKKLLNLMAEKQDAVQTDEISVLMSSLKNFVADVATNATPAAASTASSVVAPGANSDSQPTDPQDEGVFVSNEKLESFMTVSGEMIVFKNNFELLVKDGGANKEQLGKRLMDLAYSLRKITDRLQHEIMEVRKIKLDSALARIPRIVRQTAQVAGKKIEFKSEGLDLSVDRSIAKILNACLVHVIRNSIDHGIESDEKRRERGKPEKGNVTLAIVERDGRIIATVEDDGGGVVRSKVLARAIERGLVSEVKSKEMTDEQVVDLLFMPGFSTAAQVSSLSGRGVGMDVVRSTVAAVGGKVIMTSVEGQGSRMEIMIPLVKTVMVEDTVICRNGDLKLAVPVSFVSEILPMAQLQTVQLSDHRTCQFRGKTVVFGSYAELLGLDQAAELGLKDDKSGTLIILEHKGSQVGLLVNAIEYQFEAVVRPIDSLVQLHPAFKGTTVLGEDQIAYVIAPDKLIEHTFGGNEAEEAA